MDLFASTLSHKTNIFYSRNPTLGSSGANALNFKWDKKSYCHPPKALMQEVFRKIEAEPKLDMMLVFLKTSLNTDFKKFLDAIFLVIISEWLEAEKKMVQNLKV